MADDGQVIRGINWRQAFPFTHIFRSFRIAIHLSKLILGLALFLTVYLGGSILDGIWPVHARGVGGEVEQYEQIALYAAPGPFSAWRDQTNRDLDDQYAALLTQYNIDQPQEGQSPDDAHQKLLDDAHNRRHISDIEQAIIDERNKDVSQIESDYQKEISSGDNGAAENTAAPNPLAPAPDANNPLAAPAIATPAPPGEQANLDAARQRDLAIANTYDQAWQEYQSVEMFKGVGLFKMFYQYETQQITRIARAAVRNDWLSRTGVLTYLYNFFAIGPVWLIWEHTIFAVLFIIIFLFAWSLFGGAISRIAAVHVAREEKISVRQAMNFAVGKMLSFASAPVIPLLIVLVIGLIVSAVALIGNIPELGPIVIGALFALALLAGFVITLVLLGTAGGFNLMYPTIAVEGSDSFDAISRSFSYVYARPWRMLFYTAVAVVYGAVTYLFVHMFIWMMLVITHHFVGIGLFVNASDKRDLLQVMWPSPNYIGRLTYPINVLALNGGEKIGAYLIKFWVMLLVSFLAAFTISLYFSANTIIYFLMRNEVDATELDDVYIEQADDELEPIVPGTTVVTTTTVTVEAVPTTPPPEAPPA